MNPHKLMIQRRTVCSSMRKLFIIYCWLLDRVVHHTWVATWQYCVAGSSFTKSLIDLMIVPLRGPYTVFIDYWETERERWGGRGKTIFILFSRGVIFAGLQNERFPYQVCWEIQRLWNTIIKTCAIANTFSLFPFWSLLFNTFTLWLQSPRPQSYVPIIYLFSSELDMYKEKWMCESQCFIHFHINKDFLQQSNELANANCAICSA